MGEGSWAWLMGSEERGVVRCPRATWGLEAGRMYAPLARYIGYGGAPRCAWHLAGAGVMLEDQCEMVMECEGRVSVVVAVTTDDASSMLRRCVRASALER